MYIHICKTIVLVGYNIYIMNVWSLIFSGRGCKTIVLVGYNVCIYAHVYIYIYIYIHIYIYTYVRLW